MLGLAAVSELCVWLTAVVLDTGAPVAHDTIELEAGRELCAAYDPVRPRIVGYASRPSTRTNDCRVLLTGADVQALHSLLTVVLLGTEALRWRQRA